MDSMPVILQQNSTTINHNIIVACPGIISITIFGETYKQTHGVHNVNLKDSLGINFNFKPNTITTINVIKYIKII